MLNCWCILTPTKWCSFIPALTLRILEELHYHSLNDSRYIYEIKSELVRTGITPPDDKRRTVTVSIKEKLKETDFWKNGLMFLNKQEKNSRENIKQIKDIIGEIRFKHKLKTGKTIETGVFEEPILDSTFALGEKNIKFNEIQKNITRKALDKIDFYYFSNLKQFFPNLNSIDEFLTSDSYLGQIKIEINGLNEQLNNLTNKNKYEIALNVFKELTNKIKSSTTEYIGTKQFYRNNIKDIVSLSKTSEILIGGEDKEYGVAMNLTRDDSLRLNLGDKDWYMYDDNYGTSEEKYFIHFIRNAIENLEKKYKDIYLLRNEKIFKIYKFSDGAAIEPDFVLFLTEKDTDKALSFQLFVEPKGEQLFKTDQWKEDFLKEIEEHFEISDLFETDRYKLIGLPFYNEELRKDSFRNKFNEVLNLQSQTK